MATDTLKFVPLQVCFASCLRVTILALPATAPGPATFVQVSMSAAESTCQRLVMDRAAQA